MGLGGDEGYYDGDCDEYDEPALYTLQVCPTVQGVRIVRCQDVN